MKKIYRAFCKFEEVLAMCLLGGLAALVFISALMRTLKHPLNWAQDVALVAFAWLIFFGSDIAVRGSGLIGIDMLVKRFPPKVQKAIDIVFKIMILVFLCILVYYGIIMTKTGWKRQITALEISYGWVTMAVPTGAFFMIISTAIKLIERIRTPADQEIKKEAGRELA
ncbi:MAG: TRAP transporter small permease [Oscillospiraceae bacterium]|nr:TRAP transporter small permease [Oscillospiraceae bacterium]